MSDKSGRIKWTNQEWERVAVNMLPFLEQGLPRAVALGRSQKHCLPSERRRDKASLTHAAAPSSAALNKYLEMARALSEDERAQKTVPMPVRKPPAKRGRMDEGREYKGNVRWTTLEKARIYRMVEWFRSHGVDRPDSRLIIEAQELVLPVDRRRSVKGIGAGVTGGHIARTLADGKANVWLVKDEPFTPPRPPGSVSDDSVSGQTGESPGPEQALEATETALEGVENAAGYYPPPPPHSVPDGGPLVPSSSSSLRQVTSDAARQFGATLTTTLTTALDSLLMSHAALVVHTLDAKIAEQSNRMGQELAALIASRLQSTVRGIMEQELGGPVGTSAPAPASATATATPVYATPAPAPAPAHETPKPRQLKVDVVGLNTPAMEQLVKAAFNGETDIRFFDPDSKNSYAPHRDRECIMLTHRIPHVLKDKIRAAKVEPLYVKPTPGHVIHAIEELLRAQAVAQAAHQH